VGTPYSLHDLHGAVVCGLMALALGKRSQHGDCVFQRHQGNVSASESAAVCAQLRDPPSYDLPSVLRGCARLFLDLDRQAR
jgi:hypothetical protein